MAKILADLLRDLEVQESYGDLQTIISGLSYNSRQVKEGDLFVAVQGTRWDGHQFIDDALRRGAHAIVVQAGKLGAREVGKLSKFGATLIEVVNSRRALAQLAVSFYDDPSRDLNLIGITGTNGKTTTTILLESILKHAGNSVGVIGTLGYRWGDTVLPAPMTTPESLDLQRLFHEMRQAQVTHVVMEVSSHALALGRVRDCTFKTGVFTNLSQDHLDFHKTLEDYFAAKALLFREYLCMNGNCPIAVINEEDPYGERLRRNLLDDECWGSHPEWDSSTQDSPFSFNGTIWSYSISPPSLLPPGRQRGKASMETCHNWIWIEKAELRASGIRAKLSTPQGPLKLDSPLLGRLNLFNLLASVTTALALEIPKDAICEGIEAVHSVEGRLQPVPTSTGYDVVVDYAHTPDAMEKSLTCLRELTQGHLLVVFGCGGDRDRGKRPLMGDVAARLGDFVILTSDNPRSEPPEAIIGDIEQGLKQQGLKQDYIVEVNRREAIRLALSMARPGDMVFIGGKGHETYQIIGNERLPFDDRLEVMNCLKSTETFHQNRNSEN
jgi:UDP-N-acetylmuramoyl-L-alanyl-D-glutamate--2,6-diaminopimelate ligase